MGRNNPQTVFPSMAKPKPVQLRHNYAIMPKWFTDAEITLMEQRLALAESVTIPKSDALRIIQRMRAAAPILNAHLESVTEWKATPVIGASPESE